METPRRNIYGRVRDFILERGLVRTGDSVLLSLSAGKDSMALLDIMMALGPSMGFSIGVFHLNHLTRGGESDGDERFVADLARERGIALFAERHDFRVLPPGESFETHARAVRYALLEKRAAAEGYTRIATAHTRSDNAETLFMRILSGTGIAGLRGIETSRGNIIRPLLCVSAEEVYSHLHEKKIPWREDSSNKDTRHLRNFVRLEALPALYSRFPGGEEALSRLAIAAEEHSSLLRDLLEEKFGSLYEKSGEEVIIRYSSPHRDAGALKFALACAIRECLGEFVSRAILGEMMRKLGIKRSHLVLYRNSSYTVKKTLRNGERLIIITPTAADGPSRHRQWEYRVDLRPSGEQVVPLPEIRRALRLMRCDFEFFCENRRSPDILFIAVPDNIEYLVVRNRRPGDRIKISGGTKKVKELMIENKLDNTVKYSIPLIEIDSRVAGILAGLSAAGRNRVAVDFQAARDSKHILALCSAEYPLDRILK
jgi:tRNA(Ile)-lysidine synthase